MYISAAANYSGGLECNEKSNLGERDSYICTLYKMYIKHITPKKVPEKKLTLNCPLK